MSDTNFCTCLHNQKSATCSEHGHPTQMSKTAEEILDDKQMDEYPILHYSYHNIIEAMEEYAQACHSEEVASLKAEIERLKGLTSKQLYDMYWKKQSEEENKNNQH